MSLWCQMLKFLQQQPQPCVPISIPYEDDVDGGTSFLSCQRKEEGVGRRRRNLCNSSCVALDVRYGVGSGVAAVGSDGSAINFIL